MPYVMLIIINKLNRTQMYASSSLPSAVSAWNSLPTSAKTADSFKLQNYRTIITLEADCYRCFIHVYGLNVVP